MNGWKNIHVHQETHQYFLVFRQALGEHTGRNVTNTELLQALLDTIGDDEQLLDSVAGYLKRSSNP